jgi:fructosamine-3-kinase
VNWADKVGRILGSRVTGGRRLGGDLGGAALVELADGRRVVAKQGQGAEAEGAMLEALRRAGAPAPEVLHRADGLLIMTWVEAGGRADEAAWADLAQVLERLHRPVPEAYGWQADHRFGPVAIANTRGDDWVEFWARHRILCHAPHVGAALGPRLEALAARLGELIPRDPPAGLLHGDLWGGNILFANGRVAALVDPACYYGHREVDVAMLTLFDHPPDAFFAALSLEPGWRERLPVYRLWPLLVHLRLFGNSYRSAVLRALEACGV